MISWKNKEVPKKEEPIEAPPSIIIKANKTKYKKNNVTLVTPFDTEIDDEMNGNYVISKHTHIEFSLSLTKDQLKNLHDILNEFFSNTKEQ